MNRSILQIDAPEPAHRGLRTCLLVLAALAGLCWAQLASAATPAGLVVIPRPATQTGLSYFKLQGQPGALVRAGSVILRNPTRRRIRVALSAVDGETLGTLGSGYAAPGSRAHGSTLWLRLGRRTVSLAPGGSASVRVAAVVPAGAQPGDYLSGVSIEALNQHSETVKKRGVAVASISRYAIGVEVTLPGQRRPLIQFTGAQILRQPAGLTFALLARNAGNVVLQGVHGQVRITRDGRTVVSAPIPAGTFVTHTNIAYPVNAFREAPPEGTRYHITAWLRYPGGIARLNETVTFGHGQAVIQKQYTHPSAGGTGGTAWWRIAGVVAAILYGLFTTVLLLRRRRAREPRQVVQQ